MMFWMPECMASSTPYWIIGLSTTGSISLGWAFVAGRKRVPSPAAGKTALRTLAAMPQCPSMSGAPQLEPRYGTRSFVFWTTLCYLYASRENIYGIHYCGTLHRNKGYGMRGRLPGGLHPPEER